MNFSKNQDEYFGYLELEMTNEELANFYTNIENSSSNPLNLYENEYLLLKTQKEGIVDNYVWRENKLRKIPYDYIKSSYLGTIKPKDAYQRMAIDSFKNNPVTMLTGGPGSGKTLLSLAYLLEQYEYGQLDKILIFTNPVAAKGAAKLGYVPGTLLEKQLESQIGNILSSKLGGMEGVYNLIDRNVVELIPMSNIRGLDTSDGKGILITEAQNLTVELMKLALSRVGEGSQIIIEGDYTMQVDMNEYDGINNGMKRLSKVFRNSDLYGEVKLNEIYRSRIAKMAANM